ncbi:histone h2a [Plakobranchus ocellatus]|uniref:Histone h2a n=1 Tax=Plakobranchus ocellatus TaxID=259542 RepID=A0AAV3Y1J7_9GAST|nr:histone h2a [Plakobranchus ocellatus]
MPAKKRFRLVRARKAMRRGRRVSKMKDQLRTRRRRGLPSVSSVQLPLEGPKSMEDVKFNSYIKKVLKKVNPRVNLNRVSMKIMDSLMKDTLHQLAETAAYKMGKRKTLQVGCLCREFLKHNQRNKSIIQHTLIMLRRIFIVMN